MSRGLLAVVVAGVLVLAVAGAARAQQKFEYAKAEEAEELAKLKAVEWKASAQAGVIITSGNSRTTTASAGATASRKAGGNKFSADASAAYARSDILLPLVDADMSGFIEEDEILRGEATTTNFWLVRARYDRFLTKNNSVFLAARIGADEPAGKELSVGGQAGYSRQLAKTAIHELVVEGGYDFTRESFEAGGDLSIHSLRLFAGYRGTLSAATGFEAAFENLLNLNTEDGPGGERIDPLQDARINARVALTTRLSTKISFRFSFQTRFDNVPAPLPPGPVPYADGFVPLADEIDTMTEVALIVNIL
jgi:hypothetical protein